MWMNQSWLMSASLKILIIRLSSLGDILHTLPALKSLRKSFPQARIEWLVEKNNRFLLSVVDGIDEILVIDTSTLRQNAWDNSAWRQIWNLVRTLRARHYDFCLDFQGLLKTAFLSLFSGAQTRVGFSKDLVREYPAHWFYQQKLSRPDRQLHVVTLNQRLAGMIGAESVPINLDFFVSEEDSHTVDSLLKRERLTDFIVLNPGGGWPTKRWGFDKYGILAARIQAELALQVVVTTGPGEETFYSSIAKHCGSPAPRHLPIPFLQLIPLFKSARLLIAGDTGPFHLACALGTPVVGIFGATSPVRNGPWRSDEEVVTRSLPCSFCNGRTCPTQIECMDISVHEVFAAVVRRLRRKAP